MVLAKIKSYSNYTRYCYFCAQMKIWIFEDFGIITNINGLAGNRQAALLIPFLPAGFLLSLQLSRLYHRLQLFRQQPSQEW